MPRYTFEWKGADVVVYTLPGRNYWRTVCRAKVAYYDGPQLVVIGACNEVIRFKLLIQERLYEYKRKTGDCLLSEKHNI